MPVFRLFLVASTLGIYALTVIAIIGHGLLWPVTAFGDLAALNWRSQFNFDFVIFLVLSSSWIVWREGAGAKAYSCGFLNIFLGGMFCFPYLLLASYRAQGDIRKLLLGANT